MLEEFFGDFFDHVVLLSKGHFAFLLDLFFDGVFVLEKYALELIEEVGEDVFRNELLKKRGVHVLPEETLLVLHRRNHFILYLILLEAVLFNELG